METRSESQLLEGKLPCPNKKCASSDAYHIYTDHAYCYSCKSYWPPEEVPELKGMNNAVQKDHVEVPEKDHNVSDIHFHKEMKQILEYPHKGFKERKIPTDINEFYDVRCSFDPDGEMDAHYYPYGVGTTITGYKIRKLLTVEKPGKDFYSIGKLKGLFGQPKFNKGGKRIIITEGEIDCLSVAKASQEHYKSFYPVVSLPNGAGSDRAIIDARDFLRSFEEVVLCYDQDDPGKQAARSHARLIGIDKCKIVNLPEKDPNEVLLKHGPSTLLRAIWDAEQWSPEGILTKEDLWQELVTQTEKESIPYPTCVNQLNAKLKGRRIGEITLWASGTGAGKSTIIREIIIHTRETTEDRIGIVALEEGPGETAKHLCAVAMSKNPSEEVLTPAELEPVFNHLFKDDRIRVLNHYESEGTLLDTMEHMALLGCKWIILDHLTLLASETHASGSENANVDAIMNRMRRLVKQHDVHIDVISQLRKMGDTGKSFEDGIIPSLDDIKGCFRHGTEVLTYKGLKKPVQDIAVGEELMGDDGTPREVLKLCRGIGQMYRITMKTSGNSFICNDEHVLTLSYNDEVFDITVKDFLAKSSNYQTRCKQHYSSGYELEEQELPIEPYAFGAWLGDGSKSAFRVMDAGDLGVASRVAVGISAVAKAPGNRSREYYNFDTGVKGEMLNKLRGLGVLDDKHIPEIYRYNSIENRLALLAGLIDTDGTYSKKDGQCYFYQKDEAMAIDVLNLARSVGFYSNIRSQIIKGEYASNGSSIHVVTISGDLERIPAEKVKTGNTRNNPLKRGIVVEKLDVQPYYGFTLGGNGRFLLGNHIITHNSGAIKQVSFNVIGFARNLNAEDELERNTINLSVLKCRHTGITGPCAPVYYSRKTNRICQQPPKGEYAQEEFELTD